MIDKLVQFDNWELVTSEEQFENLKNNDNDKESLRTFVWKNNKSLISPILIYLYFKSKFGEPNGIITLMNNPSTDNLTHWHYVFKTPEVRISFIGMASGIEIMLYYQQEINITEDVFLIFINSLISEFTLHKKEIDKVKPNLEHWKLFINPFARIEYTLQECLNELEKINLTEPPSYQSMTHKDIKTKKNELNLWVANVRRSASLGLIIRMLSPVLAESLINLIILIFRKDEFIRDDRLYQNLLKQPIDVRIKTLHINCNCFEYEINYKTVAFKAFHTLMNNRNEILHGNVNPEKLIIEDVWFDHKIIPLFEKDESVIRKTIKNYCTNVEPNKAIGDFQVVSDLIELILLSMDEVSLRSFVALMGSDMPGLNLKTKKVGILFNSNVIVEGYFGKEK